MTLKIEHIRSIYFLGIGGIGMSALARYFLKHGVSISGYDKTPSGLTEELSSEGMNIHYEDDPSKIPADVELVIYTPAIPKDLQEFRRIRELKLPFYKRAEVLGLITRDKFTVAVAGTHGKTTITSMIAHILKNEGKPVSALIGGISKNWMTNYITSGEEEIMAVEADEYDRSFLQLHPDIAVISSMDADHLDIYHSRESLLESFRQFALQVKERGRVIFRSTLAEELPALPGSVKYSTEEHVDFTLENLRIEEGKHVFNIKSAEGNYPEVRMAVPGRHNVENALAAAAVCRLCGVSMQGIAAGLNSYQGVRRRFEIRVDQPGRIYIDDYAHHPGELNAVIQAVRELYPGRKVTGIFQPHLYSRTRDFAEGFASSLDQLDEVILLDIYPARERPIPGVTSSILLDKIKTNHKHLIGREEVLPMLDRIRPEVLLTLGAGDIDLLTMAIENLIKSW